MRIEMGLVVFAFILSGMMVTAAESEVKGLLDAGFTPQGELRPEVYTQLAMANADFKRLPDTVQSLFGNQRIRLDLTLNDGSQETLGIITVNNSIQTATRYAPRNPTLIVRTDEATIHMIANTEDKASAFVRAVNTGKLRYEGKGPGAGLAPLVADAVVFLSNLVAAMSKVLGF